MDRQALDYLLMMVENEPPNFEFNEDFDGIAKAFGDLKMRVPPDARMSDNVVDMRKANPAQKPKRSPLPDNMELNRETGEIIWKPEDEQPPLPKMFEHDVRRTIFENVTPSFYADQQFEREERARQAEEERAGMFGALKRLLGIR